MKVNEENPLGSEKISRLLHDFALPSIIAMLVGALYNIVDQFFIGRSVGMYGNAATNVALPLTTVCTALGLLFGVGGASNFNLKLGQVNARKRLNILVSHNAACWKWCGAGGICTGIFKTFDDRFWRNRYCFKVCAYFCGNQLSGFPVFDFGDGGQHFSAR